MDAERERLERARRKNLEYIRQLDEQQAAREGDELLAAVSPEFLAYAASGASTSVEAPSAAGVAKPPKAKGGGGVYITGLTSYSACKQLESLCAKLGKVRRLKFYQDKHGGLKGDAVVIFSSRHTTAKAMERLNHLEIKPGVVITATEANFSHKTFSKSESSGGSEPPSASRAPAGSPGPRQELPSRAIVLNHIWDPLEPHDRDTEFFADLEDDMRSECSKHGAVERVELRSDGSVLVRFVEPEAASACRSVMHGRWFAGRQIDACFHQPATAGPDDADAKVQAFLASVGG